MKIVYGTAIEWMERALSAQAERDALRGFIADFAAHKFDAIRVKAPRDPRDEQDPITEAQPVWSWQDDARALLKGESK